MSDVSLVPVDHQPDFEGVSLVPVDHNPFTDDIATPPAQAQPQRVQQPPEQAAAGLNRNYITPSSNNTQQLGAGESWNPDAGKSSTSELSGSATPTSAQDKPTYDWSQFNQPFGELNPASFTPTQQIGHFVAHVLPMDPRRANSVTITGGKLLGLTPLGMAGSALDLIYATHRGDLPRALVAAAGLIPPAKGVGRVGVEELARVAAEEVSPGLRALTATVPRSPASRAAEKGFSGMGTTPNGGPTLAGTNHLYPAGEGQRSVVKIPLTGSRRRDFDLANERGGFTETPKKYVWHHVDDFNPQTGKSSLELITKEAHRATIPHAGSVAQYEKFHGIPYKR